jgi:hypothetical protein
MHANDLYYLQAEIEYRQGRFPQRVTRRRRHRRLQTHSTQPRTTSS